jgi:hypothetical protein
LKRNKRVSLSICWITLPAGSANLYNLPIEMSDRQSINTAEYMNLSAGKLCRLNVEPTDISFALPEDFRFFAGK